MYILKRISLVNIHRDQIGRSSGGGRGGGKVAGMKKNIPKSDSNHSTSNR